MFIHGNSLFFWANYYTIPSSLVLEGRDLINNNMANQGYQWITINSMVGDTNSTATGSIVGGTAYNNVSVTINQTGGGMGNHTGIVSGHLFPSNLGGVATNIPLTTNQIKNTKAGIVTAQFSRSVTDILIAFGSVGGVVAVPVIVSRPFTPLWAAATGGTTTYQNQVGTTAQYTQFTGHEGNNIIRIDGTLTEVSFQYTVEEFYSTFSFGFVDQNDSSTNPCNFLFDKFAHRSEGGCRRFKRLRHLGYL